jgi:hypothetical protein
MIGDDEMFKLNYFRWNIDCIYNQIILLDKIFFLKGIDIRLGLYGKLCLRSFYPFSAALEAGATGSTRR